MIKFEKRYNGQGEVAVLYSPGYGAGWSTWALSDDEREASMYDSRIVDMVLAGKASEITSEFIENLWEVEHFYAGGAERLCVEWIGVGNQFRINEYDGFETIEINANVDWDVA